MLLYQCSLTLMQLDTMTMSQLDLLDWCEPDLSPETHEATYWFID